jgi:hypothetical protein
MPNMTRVQQLIYDERSRTATETNKTLTSPTLTSPTITGTKTDSSTGTITGQNTFSDMIESDFNPYTRIWVRSDFTQTVNKKSVISGSYVKSVMSFDPDWVVSGSGAAAVAGFTGAANSAGGATLNHSSASSTFVFMKPSHIGRLAKINWSTSKAPRFRAVLKTAAIGGQKIVMGLYSGSVRPARFIAGTNTKNRAEVYFDQIGDSRFHACNVASTSASSSATLSGVVAADTIYDIEIRVSTSRITTIYVNSTLVATFTTALKASKRLVPIIGLQTEDDDAAQSGYGLHIFHTLLSQDINAT